jgi:UDP-glucose 4-epimerase
VPGTRFVCLPRVIAAVTGGAGFIGSNLVDALLARGDDVVVFDDLSFGKRADVDARARFVERDVRDGVDLGGVDIVFHLAAHTDVTTSVERPVDNASIDILGTIRVLEAARQQAIQVVFTSTGGALYGECDGPAPEQTPREPPSPYGISKLCAEEYVAGWNRIHGSRHVVLRLANVYGPRQASSLEGGVVAVFLDRMAKGEPTAIFGDGRKTRDFVYVADVVDALLAAAGHDAGVFNIGSGEETSVLALHAACSLLAGAPGEPLFEPARRGEIRRSVLDPSRARAELGWSPRTSLEEGLGRTWSWTTATALA